MFKGLAGFWFLISRTAKKKCVWGIVCQYITGVKSAGSLFLIHLLGGFMKCIFDAQRELELVRSQYPEAFAVFYQSQSNRFNYHYAVMRSPWEFQNFVEQSRDWDFKFNRLSI
jgi:hypothetical protein